MHAHALAVDADPRSEAYACADMLRNAIAKAKGE